MSPFESLPAWEKLLAAERHLQQLVPGTVLVGGTAAALHAGHRQSLHGDHVLEERLSEAEVARAFLEFDEIYRQPNGASPLAEAAERLAAAAPSDLPTLDLAGYRGLRAFWSSWEHVVERGRYWAPLLARVALRGMEAP